MAARAERWRGRLNRANAAHVAALTAALKREFALLLKDLDLKRPQDGLRAHANRLRAILAAHKRQAAATFGFLALEMLTKTGAKIDGKIDIKAEPPSRAEQVSRVLVELARTVANGALVALTAEALAQDRQLVAAIEAAILSAPDPAPAAIAARLLDNRHVATRLAQARAVATGGEAIIEALTNPTGDDPGAMGEGRNDPPADPPGEPPSGGGDPPSAPPPPRRSRFSELVERMVREDAPNRARSIAMGEGETIARVLAQGAREGWSEQRIRKELEAHLGAGVADYRARRIARTELGAAQNSATLAIAKDREAAGERLEKVWVAIDDGRTRPSHAAADDQAQPLAAPFAVGQSLLMHPGDPTAPLGEIVNCFPGETPVTALGHVRKVYRRWYEGAMVSIETQAGHRLTGTPHHPVLTKNGWVALGALKPGDDVIGHRLEIDGALAQNEPQSQPVSIAKCFDLAAKAFPSGRTGGRRQDFHGDGGRGEVEIIALEWELRRETEPATVEDINQIPFAKPDVSLAGVPCGGALGDLIVRANAASNSDVSGAHSGLAGGAAHLRHAHAIGFAAATQGDPVLDQNSGDDAAIAPHDAGEREHAGAGQILLNDAVVSVGVKSWRGHVYNLETEANAFVAGFVVVSNCRCAMVIRRSVDKPAIRAGALTREPWASHGEHA